jgi:RimJ/RimL family protein N-acetyltransferase
MTGRIEVPTERLVLVGADSGLLRSDLAGKKALARKAGAIVPRTWPPEHHDRPVIEWMMGMVGNTKPDDIWRPYYILLREPRTLIGTCGYKGPPDAVGRVEVGYSVLPAFQRRGFASEAVSMLMAQAFAHGAREVAAETFPSLLASRRVMEKCGMASAAAGSEVGTVRYARRGGS